MEGAIERGLQFVGLHYHRFCRVDYLGIDPSGILWREQPSETGGVSRHRGGYQFAMARGNT